MNYSFLINHCYLLLLLLCSVCCADGDCPLFRATLILSSVNIKIFMTELRTVLHLTENSLLSVIFKYTPGVRCERSYAEPNGMCTGLAATYLETPSIGSNLLRINILEKP